MLSKKTIIEKKENINLKRQGDDGSNTTLHLDNIADG
jgi:hypothetical protein